MLDFAKKTGYIDPMPDTSQPKLRIINSDGALKYELIVHDSAAESSFPDSHVYLEVLESLIVNADLTFWEKFDGQVSANEYFSTVLTALIKAWVYYGRWNGVESEGLIHVHQELNYMLSELKRGGHLPETVDNPPDEETDEGAESEEQPLN